MIIQCKEYLGLKDVSWEVPTGLSVLVGPNGGGKTRLLTMPQEQDSLLYYGDYSLKAARDNRRRHHKTVLTEHGEHIGDVLFTWSERYPERFQSLVQHLREIFPNFQEMKFVSDTAELFRWFVKCTGWEEFITIRCLPNSMLAAMMHLCAALGAPMGAVLAFDPFEYHFHPETTRALLQIIAYIASEKDLSVILTTQSAVVLNFFDTNYEHVFIVDENRKQLPTPLLSLRIPEWLSHFNLGDLYLHGEFGDASKVELGPQTKEA